MLKATHLLSASALMLAVAACGSGTKSDQEPTSPASMDGQAMNDASNPFSADEIAMKQKMDAAVGADVSDTWVAQMIEHHRGAIAMSKTVLGLNPTPDVRMMAEQTIARQGKEIEDLKKMLSRAAPNAASMEPYRPSTMAMHQAMMAAKGGDASKTYMRKMLEHHRGAIAMSDVVLAQGDDSKVKAQARKTRDDQAKEAAMVEEMISGKPMTMATPAASESMRTRGATSATSIPASPATKPQSAPKKAAPAPSATPSGNDMKDMPGMKM